MNEIKEVLNLLFSSNEEVVVCPKCYLDIYHILVLQEGTLCHSCGATSKPGTKFYRHSPDGKRVSQHIKDTTGDEITLHPESVICLSCYKLHSYILKMLDSEQEGTDSMLRSMVDTWKVEANGNDTDLLTVALLRTVLFVAEHMLQDKALLLPQACNIFLQSYGINHTGSIRAVQLDLDIGDSSVKFSARWLLNHQSIYLSHYMSYQCVHMRIGTILFRAGGNILASLSYALSTALQMELTLPTVTNLIKPARQKKSWTMVTTKKEYLQMQLMLSLTYSIMKLIKTQPL